MSSYQDKSTHHTTLFALAVGLACAVTIVATLALVVGWYPHAQFFTFRLAALIAALGGFAAFSDLRRFDVDTRATLLAGFFSILRLWGVVYFSALFVLYLTKTTEEVSRLVMLIWFLATPFTLLLTAALCRVFARRLYSGSDAVRKTVFIGFSEDAQELATRLQESGQFGFQVLGYFDSREGPSRINSLLPRLGRLEDANDWVAINEVDVVFVGLVHARSTLIAPVVEALLDTVVSIYFVPESRLFGLRDIRFTDIAGLPVLVAYETPFIGLARVLKRSFDIGVSLLLLILFSPVMLVVATGVKLTSSGPVLFRQKRYGAGGQEISIFKFRSMRNEAAAPDGVLHQATVGDARVTAFGRFLRKSSLDELPQFFNVLGGSMSMVGPRPHAVQHNELYRKQIKGYMLRHKVKPGITGWAQVNGLRGETDTLDKMERRIRYDLHYINNWSIGLDFRIIFMTVGVLFRDRHAY
ncbi:undecaprenyl-phosphate glucose phosphotransferase [Herbaspirillum sp. RTI4]|uniref:undecaprenyl-phosphate glucose phosphotransferase n=1 Tax=Herbaspirillum sp. RTI4 TaxID=3048640 RepID=UPI002AB3BFF7|nr:undecaprenyl-phosphate glucose phosphotransferase [Herbaspirillum sp. RTI4]MDY7578255.1 undecaprenyl-phosphate glucose phosphotransferase [Herbaspirillum sp. RTI4]MEA9983472.1 undecaprenyl-phosphate glucose phosphotransferase [Herbaspirillum sp. RTI4]